MQKFPFLVVITCPSPATDCAAEQILGDIWSLLNSFDSYLCSYLTFSSLYKHRCGFCLWDLC